MPTHLVVAWEVGLGQMIHAEGARIFALCMMLLGHQQDLQALKLA